MSAQPDGPGLTGQRVGPYLIEELIGCPVALLSTSPEREDTILMSNPFET